jgi:hypothetical protein
MPRGITVEEDLAFHWASDWHRKQVVGFSLHLSRKCIHLDDDDHHHRHSELLYRRAVLRQCKIIIIIIIIIVIIIVVTLFWAQTINEAMCSCVGEPAE